MSDKLYDFLNKFQRWLPAVAVLYLALCKIWNLPFGDEVNQTILAIAAFLATTLEIAGHNYEKSKAKAFEDLYQGEE